jgi:hypothetical protein
MSFPHSPNFRRCPPRPASNGSNNLNGGIGKSLGNLFRQDFNSFQFGVTFDFPIKNRAAKAELGKNLVEAEKLDIEKRRVSQQIAAEVRNAAADFANIKNAPAIGANFARSRRTGI